MRARHLARWALAVLALVASVLAAPAMAAPSRLALVIGNEKYENLGELPLASRNADQLADALTRSGFASLGSPAGVTASRNLTREGLANTLHDFSDAIARSEPGSVAFVYFAGHGIAKDRRGDVYLLATDSLLREGTILDEMGLPLADMIELLRQNTDRTVIIVVDACRNVAPAEFVEASDQAIRSRRARDAQTRDATADGGGWGLESGQVGLLRRGFKRDTSSTTRDGADYFVAFSTSPDRVAYDSDVFSSVLASEIARGRVDVLTLFKRVGERVAEETRRQGELQLPTYEVGIYRDPPCFGVCAATPDPARFFDCPGCPWMKVLPEAEYLRGSPADEKGRDKDEPAPTPTRVKSFAIGQYEVTRAEWTACERAGACRSLSGTNAWQSPRAPVAGLSRGDAEAYIAWLSRESGVRYRLPTEAEWEYAARAGGKTAFHTGDRVEPSQAAYDYSASHLGSRTAEYRGAPEPGGSFEPNAFGLFDLMGNVWEWACGGADASACAAAVLRGGSYKSAPRELRAANRLEVKPSVRREDVGLRVARDL